LYIMYNRVDDIAKPFSSRPNWDVPSDPHPSHADECVRYLPPPPTPFGSGGTLLCRRGGGGSQFGRGEIQCGTLGTVYLYFVYSIYGTV
jgi:hypothetical protein